MSSNKLALSRDRSQKLELLKSRLGLRPYMICRLAIGRSLANKESVKEFQYEDSSGREFNRYTLAGDFDVHYKALIYQHEFEASGKRIPEQYYFSVYFRRHMERGIDDLYQEFIRMNTPVKFLLSLANGDN